MERGRGDASGEAGHDKKHSNSSGGSRGSWSVRPRDGPGSALGVRILTAVVRGGRYSSFPQTAAPRLQMNCLWHADGEQITAIRDVI